MDNTAYKGSLRHRVPVLCSVGALARYLIQRFTIQGVPLPDPGSAEWAHTMLWAGSKEGVHGVLNGCHLRGLMIAWVGLMMFRLNTSVDELLSTH